MSLYDVLDIIGDINSEVKFKIVGELAGDATKVNKIKNKLSRGYAPLEVITEEFPLNILLSDMEYSDFEDRFQEES